MSIINMREVKKAHADFLRHNARMLTDAADFAATHTKQHIASSRTFKSHTGKLVGGVKTKVIRLKSGVVMRQTNKTKYAKFVEFGTKPHRIKARRRKALKFGSGNSLFFRSSVNHPGTSARRFGYRAQGASFRVMGNFIRGEMDRISRRF